MLGATFLTARFAAQMHGAVRELEAGLEEISLSQQYANRGIYLLCKVVGEMMKGASPTHAGFELENYVKHPPTISGRAVPVQPRTCPGHPSASRLFSSGSMSMRFCTASTAPALLFAGLPQAP